MKPVLAYYATRIVNYVVVLFLAFTITFFFLRLMPGDPVDVFLASMAERGVQMGGEANAAALYRQRFGLDQSLFGQYLVALRRTFLEFDLGISYMNFGDPVSDLILRRLPWSVWLLGVASLISWVLGLITGTLSAWFRDTWLGRVIYNLGIGGAQVPQYVIALILVLVFVFWLDVLPSGGAYRAGLTPGFDLEFIGSALLHAFLPAMAIVLATMLLWTLTTRALTISILGEDYILFAEAKGLRKMRILNRYVLRNTVLPQVTAFALGLAGLVNGAYLVEWIFGYPGVGTLLISAVTFRDFNVVQGIMLISIVAVLTANLVMELINPLIDPRIRTGGREG